MSEREQTIYSSVDFDTDKNIEKKEPDFLTPKQLEALKFIENFVEEHGYPPTVRETIKELDLRSTDSGKRYLRILSEKGYIEQKPRQSRAYKVIVPSSEAKLIGKIKKSEGD